MGQRSKQLLAMLVLVAWTCLFYSLPLKAEVLNQKFNNNLVQRFEQIKSAMQKVRFCYNNNCFYRDLHSQIIPPATAQDYYIATVTATIDRPAAVLDTADYTFAFIDQHWQLVKGEEYTDVAEYVFKGDRYEIFSVHSNRSHKGNLAQARQDKNLKAGYLAIYYDILNNGVERYQASPLAIVEPPLKKALKPQARWEIRL